MSAQYELYRRSSLGMALTDTLDELIQGARIDPQIAMKILGQFDLCMSETLRERVRVTIKITGHLHIYRFCDDVWTFVVENAELTMGGGVHIKTDVIKVVACTARSASLGA